MYKRQDYSSIQEDQQGRAGVSAPIGLAYTPEAPSCAGGDAGTCDVNPAQFFYEPDAKIWSVFEVERPAGIRKPPSPDDCGFRCPADLAQQQATYDRDLGLYETLNEKIRDFNADFRNNRMIKDFTYYEVTQITTETGVTQSDPGKIIVGGNARLVGNVQNDKSQIIAGGALNAEGGTLANVGAEGSRTVQRAGTMVYTYEKRDSRRYDRSPYGVTVSVEKIDAGLGVTQQNTGISPGGVAPGASAIATALPPATVTRVSLPGNRVVAVVTLPPVIPTSALYRVMLAPDAPYLIATDRQFLGMRTVTSSDFLLRQLNQNGTYVLKRLGDGFYEQKLVAEQVMLATGQRFVGDYTDNETQYKALLGAGADFAGSFGLTVGTAFSEDQMRHLARDIVWLVEQTVTLPDGSPQKVLAPQVYLAVRPGDLRGDGTLIAGGSVHIDMGGDVANSGTLGARNALVVTGQNLRNNVGTIQGKNVSLNARQDIDNIAGLLKGDSVALSATRDINLTTTASSASGARTRTTFIDGVSRIDAGKLDAFAGRDVNATAAAISATSDAAIKAGRNINLTTVTQSYADSVYWKSKNRADLSLSQEVGTSLSAGGSLQLVAAQDVNARAAQVFADKNLTLLAGHDVSLTAGVASGSVRDEHYQKVKGFLSSRSTHTIDSSAYSTAQGTQLSGESVLVGGGRDIRMTGAQVLASKDIVLDAARDLAVQAGVNAYAEDHYRREKKSGFSAGGMGISYGRSDSKSNQRVDGATQSDARSLLGTTSGNVILTAGRNASIVGSDIVAGKAAGDVTGRTGNIDIQAQNVAILAGRDTETTHSDYANKQSSFGVKLVGTPADTFKNLSNAGSAKAKVQELAHSGVTTPGVTLNFSSSKSSGSRDTFSQVSSGSDLSAAGDILIRATGSGAWDASGRAIDGDIALVGSNLRAQGGVVLDAKRDIMVAGAQNQYREASQNDSKSTSISVGSMSLGDMGRAIDGGPNASGVKTFPFGTQTSSARETATGTWQTASLITGNTVYMNSRDGDIRIAGSAIDAVKNVGLSANQGSISIDTGTATRDHTSSYRSKSVGDLSDEAGGATTGIRKSSGTLAENLSLIHI